MREEAFNMSRLITVPLACVFVGVSLVEAQTLSFTDVTDEAGLAYTQSLVPELVISNYEPAMMAAGGAVADFNNDGWQDVFVASLGDAPEALFISNGPNAQGEVTFTNRTNEWFTGSEPRNYVGSGVTTGDYDHDGNVDIHMTVHWDPVNGLKKGLHRLYRNNGNGTFTGCTSCQCASGIRDEAGWLRQLLRRL